MKTVFMFSGQGSQYVGMGKELYDNFEEAKVVFDKADLILGYSIKEIMFNNEELLNDMETTLPTHQSKIRIAKGRKYDFKDVQVQFKELIDLQKNHDNYEIVTKMKNIVPEFKSQNSIYEELDIDTEN